MHLVHHRISPPAPLRPRVASVTQPTDVRMDGDFDLTIEKLIRHWCPQLAGKDLKWVHQLDFGELCLCMAALYVHWCP